MRVFLPLLIAPFLASSWAAELEARGTTTRCNADNCLRALRNPTRTAAATSFCNSYTLAHITATPSPALPPQFATQCGSGSTQFARLSSACSCYVPPPTCTNTVSDNNNCGTCGNVCTTGTTCQSGACAPSTPSDCTPYSASCSEVVNDVLSVNSVANPQLVDYRIQSAILGITSPSDFLALLGPNPCDKYTNATENAACVELLGDQGFLTELTNIVSEILERFQACAHDFAAGNTNSEIVINDPTCTESSARRLAVRDMPKRAEYSENTARTPMLGPLKSADLRFVRKQLSTCARTGDCYQTCPDCRDQRTYCGDVSEFLTDELCGKIAERINKAAEKRVALTCARTCVRMRHPLVILACVPLCKWAAEKAVEEAVGASCGAARDQLCEPMTQRCTACNAANNGICNEGNTQCCAGETGTQCGAGCCCCPRCYAPGGVNCACMPAAC